MPHARSRSGFAAAALAGQRRGAKRRAFESDRISRWIASVSPCTRSRCRPPLLRTAALRELARALVSEPRLLLLDEPAAGLNMHDTQRLAEQIRAIKEQGVTILLVEHDMSLVMGISDEIVVLDSGRKIAEARPRRFRRTPKSSASIWVKAERGAVAAEAAKGSRAQRSRFEIDLLAVRNIVSGYGPLRVLKGLSLHVNPARS